MPPSLPMSRSPPRKKKPAPKSKLTVDFGKRVRYGEADVPVFDRGDSSSEPFRPTGLDDFNEPEDNRYEDAVRNGDAD